MIQSNHSGLPVDGNLSWGSHVCHLYRTRQDLFDTLIPYFKVGLENHEACLWITSEPFPAADARAALRSVVPDLQVREQEGQIEILDHREWYGSGRGFDADRGVRASLQRAARALRQGYMGLRMAGNACWLDDESWQRFMVYESKIGEAFQERRIIGLCSYCLDRCSGSDIVDVMRNHDFALARRAGAWETVANAELKAAHEEIGRLRERARFREHLLDIVSHDMRDPLGTIALAANALLQERMLDQDASKIVARIASSAERMERLLRDLLDLTQAQLGTGMGLETASADLNAICRDVVEELALMHRYQRFELELCSNGRGHWDRRRLTQALSSLVGNAVQHGTKGMPVRIRTLEMHRAGQEGSGVMVQIHNQGAPIPVAVMPRIFEPFRNGREDGVSPGLGLGLFIAKQIVSAHGGTIDVRSTTGEGTTFEITLPRWARAIS